MKYLFIFLFPLLSFASMVDLINEYRPMDVTEHNAACVLAEYRLEQIQKNFSHQGLRDMTFLTKYGTWYENLAVEGTDIRGMHGVFNAWKSSASHNSNLLADMEYMCERHKHGYWVLIGWKTTL